MRERGQSSLLARRRGQDCSRIHKEVETSKTLILSSSRPFSRFSFNSLDSHSFKLSLSPPIGYEYCQWFLKRVSEVLSKYLSLFSFSFFGFKLKRDPREWPQGQAEARQAKQSRKRRRKKKKVRSIPSNSWMNLYIFPSLFVLRNDIWLRTLFFSRCSAVVPSVLDITIITPYDTQVILKVPGVCFLRNCIKRLL